MGWLVRCSLLMVVAIAMAGCDGGANRGDCKYDWDYDKEINDLNRQIPSVNPLYHKGDAASKADPGWVDSKIKLDQGKSFVIQPSRTIDLCGSDNTTLDLTPISGWKTLSGYAVSTGDIITIRASGSYSMWGDALKDCSEASGYQNPRWDDKCQSSEHRGLLVQTAATEGNAADLSYKEMFDYDSLLPTESYTVPNDGFLQFRVADHDNNLGASATQLTSGNYSNNTGSYHVTVSKGNCLYTNGKALYGYIGDSPPNTSKDFENTTGVFLIGKGYVTPTSGAAKISTSGELWLRIIDVEDKDYTNNNGFYSVYVGTNSDKKKADNWATDLIHTLADGFRGVMLKIGKIMFNALIEGPGKPVVKAVLALMTLYVMFTCIGFMFGIVQVTQKEFVVRIAKLAIVGALISPKSWEFFNHYFFNIFMRGMEDVVSAILSLYDDGNFTHDTNFSFVTPLIDILFDVDTWLKFISFLFAGPVGWIFLLIILLGIIFFLMAFLQAVIIYLMAYLGLTILFIVAPVCIPLVLFEDTRSLFFSWVNQMVNFVLQPIFVLGALVMFNYWIYAILTKILGYGICYKCAFTLQIPIDILGFPTLIVCLFSFWLPEGFNNEYDILASSSFSVDSITYYAMALPAMLFDAIVFLIFTYGQKEFCNYAVQLAQSIAQTSGSTSLMDAAAKGVSAIGGSAKRGMGLLSGSGGGGSGGDGKGGGGGASGKGGGKGSGGKGGASRSTGTNASSTSGGSSKTGKGSSSVGGSNRSAGSSNAMTSSSSSHSTPSSPSSPSSETSHAHEAQDIAASPESHHSPGIADRIKESASKGRDRGQAFGEDFRKRVRAKAKEKMDEKKAKPGEGLGMGDGGES